MRKATIVTISALMASSQAFAEGVAASGGLGDKGLYALGLAFLLGLAAFGATSGQSRVGAAAMEGLARNPQARNAMFVPMIVILALIESLFILSWLVANGVLGKI